MTLKRTQKQNSCPVPEGILLVIGGKENKGEESPEEKEKPADFVRLEILQTLKDLLHRKEPVVEVITSASGDSDSTFRRYKSALAKVGIKQVGHIHHADRKAVLADPMEERLKKADAVFFSGGDQLKLTTVYGGTQFLQTVTERYVEEKFVVAGTSAGAMALSTPMIYAGSQEVQELGGAIKVTTGFEFLKNVCVDTHFVHRGRVIRLAQVVVTNPSCIGIGIEEDTAIVVREGIKATIVGTGLVMVLEGFNLEGTNIEAFTADCPITARNLTMHLFSDGDVYEIPQFYPLHK